MVFLKPGDQVFHFFFLRKLLLLAYWEKFMANMT